MGCGVCVECLCVSRCQCVCCVHLCGGVLVVVFVLTSCHVCVLMLVYHRPRLGVFYCLCVLMCVSVECGMFVVCEIVCKKVPAILL